jgi:hypothetical protein
MILTSMSPGRVSLVPVTYQFPAHRSVGPGRDWDANWLMIRGEVRHPDGSTWTFTDPCLTVWEAHDLGDWLQAVADGAVAPRAGTEAPAGICFTEPDLAVSLLDRSETRCVLAVHVSLEALPPWLQGEGSPGNPSCTVALTLRPDDVVRAVAQWRQELRAFPIR